MLKRPQYFGRGCTLVAVGFGVIAQSLLSGNDLAWVVVVAVGIALMYPGFTMIGLAIWPD